MGGKGGIGAWEKGYLLVVIAVNVMDGVEKLDKGHGLVATKFTFSDSTDVAMS